MQGLMQRRELLISSILTHAERHHGGGEIVSVRDDGTLARTTYAAVGERARRLAGVLQALGVKFGDRVATLAMNSDRHLELYYAIAGIGAVCNTINPRLAPDDIAYIANHAEDGLIFADPGFLPILEGIARKIPTLRAVIAIADVDAPLNPALPPGVAFHNYETLLAAAAPIPQWPTFEETTASALCYTSGTTGRPKGVLYTHRSILLHAMMGNFADTIGLRATDRMLPFVPMFHVNAWCLPYIAPMSGAALLMPGRQLDPAAQLRLLNEEGATVSAGVPTIWLGLLNHMRETGARLTSLRRIFSGGAAFPRALMAAYQALGIDVAHAWGMTESSPIATFYAPKAASASLDAEARLTEQAKQGRVVFGVDVRAETDAGEARWDGKTPGNLVFRGHWVASQYYRQPETAVAPDGWFPTGDVGVIDAQGFVALTDRTKDLIKSGGEWISSIELENIAVGHPDVAEAAAIAVPDAKWGERPLVIVVPRTGTAPTPDSIRAFYKDKVPSWSIPDRVLIAESLPHGATGKLLKTELRKLYAT